MKAITNRKKNTFKMSQFRMRFRVIFIYNSLAQKKSIACSVLGKWGLILWGEGVGVDASAKG